jgi:pimeloyl-ACP methyl ester carboxylesterase
MLSKTISTKHSPILHYRISGEGNAVMLLHGFPEDGDLWEGVGRELAKHFKVIIPDIPGSGQSALGNDTISFETIAERLQEILIAEGIAKIVFVGHSMGGYTALAFASLFTEKVAGLSMVHSTALADSEDKIETRKKTITLIEKGGKKPFVQQMMPSLFSEGFKQQFSEKILAQIERGMALKEDSMIAYYKAMFSRPERTNVLRDALFPVQFILGNEDNLLPINCMMQQTHLSNVNFVSVYQQCGHMSMLEQPEKTLHDLKQFANYCYR